MIAASGSASVNMTHTSKAFVAAYREIDELRIVTIDTPASKPMSENTDLCLGFFALIYYWVMLLHACSAWHCILTSNHHSDITSDG